MASLDPLFKRNQQWADSMKAQDPSFFSNLADQQNPEYLWIGCSDSRVPATQIIDLNPGEVFVHRNIANMVIHTDHSSLSVLQYAVEALGVKHIIVCGHYGCGGVKASMGDGVTGLVSNWLRHIKDVSRFHATALDKLEGDEKFRRLCELNVIEQLNNLCHTSVLTDAWAKDQEVSVHGLIYDISNGVLQNLMGDVSSVADLQTKLAAI